MEIADKRCCKCKEEKSVVNFSKDKTSSERK